MRQARDRWVGITARLAIAATYLFSISSACPARASCVGDCGADQVVTVEEIISMVNIALGTVGINACRAGDASGDGEITVEEIIMAVAAALSGCTPGGPDVNGHWAGTVTISGSIMQDFTFDLVQSGSDVTGQYASQFEGGTISGQYVAGMNFTFTLTETTPGCPGSFTGTATVDGDTMTLSYAGSNCEGHFTAQGTAGRIRSCSAAEATNCCGNNVKEGRETCDGSATPTCQDLGFEGGHTECTDCRLNQRNCFTGGQCIMGAACNGVTDDCPIVNCPDGAARACLNGTCITGSCACTDDIVQCCALASHSAVPHAIRARTSHADERVRTRREP